MIATYLFLHHLKMQAQLEKIVDVSFKTCEAVKVSVKFNQNKFKPEMYDLVHVESVAVKDEGKTMFTTKYPLIKSQFSAKRSDVEVAPKVVHYNIITRSLEVRPAQDGEVDADGKFIRPANESVKAYNDDIELLF